MYFFPQQKKCFVIMNHYNLNTFDNTLINESSQTWYCKHVYYKYPIINSCMEGFLLFPELRMV